MGWLSALLPGGRAATDDSARAGKRSDAEPVPGPPRRFVSPTWTLSTPTLRSEGFAGVVVEFDGQDALRRHLDAAWPLRYVVAQLFRDPGDPGTVAVHLGDDLVGRIPRDDLDDDQSLHAALDRVAALGLPATCWARLNDGTRDQPGIGITLLTGCYNESVEPHPFPLTVPPHSWGPLLGVEQHQDVLARLVGDGDETVVGCTLTVAERNPAEGTAAGPVLLAAIDGTVVGGMSAEESAQRLPIVEALLHAGRPVHAMARVHRIAWRREDFSSSVSTVVP